MPIASARRVSVASSDGAPRSRKSLSELMNSRRSVMPNGLASVKSVDPNGRSVRSVGAPQAEDP